jgi:hypothetical protein
MAQFGNASQTRWRGLPTASVEKLGSVVLADRGRGVLAERVENVDGVGLVGELADVGLVGPAEGGDAPTELGF